MKLNRIKSRTLKLSLALSLLVAYSGTHSTTTNNSESPQKKPFCLTTCNQCRCCGQNKDSNKEDEVELLVNNGVDVNRQDSYGRTALMFAITQGNGDEVELLVNNGADVNMQNNHGYTALIAAVFLNNEEREVVRLLFNTMPLLRSTVGFPKIPFNKDIVEFLLNNGADVNAQGNYGLTALISAVFFNKKNTVEFLISRGADVNATSFILTPLMSAIAFNRKDLAELLINNGADVNSDADLLYSPLEYAMMRRCNGLLSTIFNKYINKMLPEQFIPSTPMDEIVELLINNGATHSLLSRILTILPSWIF